MNVFEFVVAIALIFAIAKLVAARNARRSGEGHETVSGTGREDSAETTRLREEVQALKERIAVLERIATDDSGRLAREIEQLRDR
jgi:hypothetical protein